MAKWHVWGGTGNQRVWRVGVCFFFGCFNTKNKGTFCKRRKRIKRCVYQETELVDRVTGYIKNKRPIHNYHIHCAVFPHSEEEGPSRYLRLG